jgi:hypothetical protein
MKISKYFFLVLGVIYLFDFIMLFFYEKNTHEFLLWEVNTWFYRIFKLFLSLILLKVFFEKHNDKLDKAES